MFFFDNVEELNRNPQSNNRKRFVKCFENILEKCAKVKVLLTARGNIGSSTMRETCIHLEGLKDDQKLAWQLFREYYLEKSKDEIENLAKLKPDQNKFPGAYLDARGKKISKLRYTKNKIGEHHLFDLLGRHPQAIILAAHLHRNDKNLTLGDLYGLIVE